MRYFFSGRRRYALACLVAVGALITAAASCEPTKEPVKEPAPAPTGLSIEPTSHDFGNDPNDNVATDAVTFTVKNNGPNTTAELKSAALSGSNPEQFVVKADNCETKMLAAGDICTVEVAFDAAGPDGPRAADLTVKSDAAADGEAVAKLSGTAAT